MSCPYSVSVIVPAYNSQAFISRCLDSLVSQTLKSIQIIVVNDGSTDNTRTICEEYCKKYNNVFLLNKENEGQGIARNHGLEFAAGEYVGFVDSDDFVELNMYEALYTQAKAYQVQWVYSYTESEPFLRDTRLKSCKNGQLICGDCKKIMRDLFFGGLPEEPLDSFLGMSVWRSIFSLELIKKNKIKFISERVVNSEDLLFNLDFLEFADCICTLEQSFYHYCHDNPTSFSVKPNHGRIKMFGKLYDEMRARASSDEQILRAQRRYLANLRVAVVEYAHWCKIKNYLETVRHLKEILNDSTIRELLHSYPIRQLPLMQSIYFHLMRYKCCFCLILCAKIRYLF